MQNPLFRLVKLCVNCLHLPLATEARLLAATLCNSGREIQRPARPGGVGRALGGGTLVTGAATVGPDMALHNGEE